MDDVAKLGAINVGPFDPNPFKPNPFDPNPFDPMPFCIVSWFVELCESCASKTPDRIDEFVAGTLPSVPLDTDMLFEPFGFDPELLHWPVYIPADDFSAWKPDR